MMNYERVNNITRALAYAQRSGKLADIPYSQDELCEALELLEQHQKHLVNFQDLAAAIRCCTHLSNG